MKYILLYILSISAFASCSESCVNTQFNATLRSESYSANNDYRVVDLTTVRKSIGNKTNISYKNVGTYSDLEYYDINNPQDGIGNISLPFNDLSQGYQVNALYFSVTDGDFTWYHGAIPFKGGRFAEIKDPTVNGGNGLAIINNQVYLSDFLKYNDGDLNIIVGKSKFDTKLHYNGLLQKNNQSEGIYTLVTYEMGKHFYEFDYFSMKGKVYDEQPWDIKIYGVGYIYDDSMYSGWTIYTNLAMSDTDDRAGDLGNAYGIPASYRPFLEESGAKFGTYNNQKGYAELFGIKYEFDALDVSFDIGSELFFTQGAWVSTNHGVAFQSDHSWYANRNATEIVVYSGVDINEHMRFSTKYTHTSARNVPAPMSITQSVPADQAYNESKFFTDFSKLELLVNYKF
jgi:hypothetical protein